MAAGADVDRAENDGWTPLLMAAQEGHSEVVAALVAARADVDRAKNNGATPLCIAAQNGHSQVVSTLLSGNAEKGIKTKWGTAEDVARRKGHAEIVALLA